MNVWLMLASYVFYGWWNPYYLALLFGTSAIDYLMVLLMDRSKTHRTRKLWLIISLVSNFGFLGYFKYSGFITENLNWVLSHIGLAFQLPDPVAYPNAMLSAFGVAPENLFTKVILPIGISFHTFQAMSYTIDAYKGTIQTERSFVRFLTFVSFFPQLVAGPIERAKNLLPQLQGTPQIKESDIADGLSLFLVGFFKKVALADYLALYVDKVYTAPDRFQSSALILATFAFAWQIYFDFSGYTDMARGIARTMGFHLMLNFNNPYVATGLGDFWNRWHISLSTWFKDYVYFPLGGSRNGKWMTYRNILITMIVSGLWHGAAWTFVDLGRVARARPRWRHGILNAVSTTKTAFPKTPQTNRGVPLRQPCLGLLPSVERERRMAGHQLSRIFTTSINTDPQCPMLMLSLILIVWVYQLLYSGQNRIKSLFEKPAFNIALALAMIGYLLVVAQPGTKAFIYFQF